jgi:holo-[acyl-carrier-protein] synthase
VSSGEQVVGAAREIVEIALLAGILETQARASAWFGPEELAYAASKSDPERRLAARLAAKRAVLKLLGSDLGERDIDVIRGNGAPGLRLSARAQRRLGELGAGRALVSLTHERRHAAAAVVLVAP